MPRTTEQQPFSSVLGAILTNGFTSLDLPDVAHLAASCKQARGHCSDLLTSQRPYWLENAVQDGHIQAVSHLLHGQLHLLHDMADELLSVPNLRLEVACELLRLGLRPYTSRWLQKQGRVFQGCTSGHVRTASCCYLLECQHKQKKFAAVAPW